MSEEEKENAAMDETAAAATPLNLIGIDSDGGGETTTNVDKQPDVVEEKIFQPSGMDIDEIPLSSSQETSSSSDFGTFFIFYVCYDLLCIAFFLP